MLIQQNCLKNKLLNYRNGPWCKEMRQHLLLFFLLLTFEKLHCTQQFIRLTHLVAILPDVMWHSPSGTWESDSTSLFWQQPLSPSTGCFCFLCLLCWDSITLTHIWVWNNRSRVKVTTLWWRFPYLRFALSPSWPRWCLYGFSRPFIFKNNRKTEFVFFQIPYQA